MPHQLFLKNKETKTVCVGGEKRERERERERNSKSKNIHLLQRPMKPHDTRNNSMLNNKEKKTKKLQLPRTAATTDVRSAIDLGMTA